MSLARYGATALLLLVVLRAATVAAAAAAETRVNIGSKAFTESVILGEAVTQLSRARGAADVHHRRELGGTRIVFNALLRGDIDVVPDIANSDIAELKKNDKVKTSVITSMSLVGLIIQTRDPLLQNVKLRQAIAAAIDVKELVATITDGLGTPNNSIIPMLSAYYGAAQKEGWAYDPAAARKLLAEAGYKGEKIVMLANKRYPESFDAAVVAQQMLKAVGLNIEIEVLEWATQLDRYTKGNYQMQAFPYSGRMDPALSYESMTGPKDKQPRKLWDNPEVQALLDKSMVVNDRAGRQAIFDTLHRRFLAEVPMVMLYNGIVGGAMSAKTQGYVSTVSSLPRAWEVTVGE